MVSNLMSHEFGNLGNRGWKEFCCEICRYEQRESFLLGFMGETLCMYSGCSTLGGTDVEYNQKMGAKGSTSLESIDQRFPFIQQIQVARISLALGSGLTEMKTKMTRSLHSKSSLPSSRESPSSKTARHGGLGAWKGICILGALPVQVGSSAPRHSHRLNQV